MDNVILIHGKKRSGKDYFAEKLKESFQKQGKTVEIFAFADALKDIVAETFEITREELDIFKNNPDVFQIIFSNKITNFRKIIQRFGTEAMKKQFGDDVWVNIVKRKILDSDADYVIVSDLRFKIELISECSIKIHNNSLHSSDMHSSETELDDHDFMFYVDNTGYPDLSYEIEKITEVIMAL